MQTRQPKQPFAYALCENPTGWSWKVLDRDGVRVAVGLAPDRASAQQWIASVYRGEGVRPGSELELSPPRETPGNASPGRGSPRRRSA